MLRQISNEDIEGTGKLCCTAASAQNAGPRHAFVCNVRGGASPGALGAPLLGLSFKGALY